jgi:excinuclease UvrABC ATPase subunit
MSQNKIVTNCLKTTGRPSKYSNDEERKEAKKNQIARSKSRPIYKELVKIYNKNYYEKHKEQRKEDYRKNNTRIMCEVCNKSLLKRNMKRHYETDLHKSNMV